MTQILTPTPASVAGDIMTTTNNGLGLPASVPAQIQDGRGNPSPFFLSQTTANFLTNGGMVFQLNGITLSATATSINTICGTTPGFPGTGAVVIPIGSIAQRPSPATRGMLRYDTDLNSLEICTSTGPDVWTTA